MWYNLSRKEYRIDVFTKAKNMVSTTIISHVNRNESNNLKISNIDYIKIMSNFLYSTIKNVSPPNTLIYLI